MLSLYSSTSSALPLSHHTLFSSHSKKRTQIPFSLKKPNTCSFICLSIGIQEIGEITQNKVLVAAAISAAIGQLSKPFTSALLYDKDIDFKSFIRPGGFPSSHSAAVVAASTSLGLERGFSDSIFGMTVIFASIVMYDAQGVRWEAGNHAKVLNKILLDNSPKNYKDDLIDSNNEGTSSTNSESLAPLLSRSDKVNTGTPNESNSSLYFKSENGRSLQSSPIPPSTLAVDVSRKTRNSLIPLKETLGHTEKEVIAGAFLGFLVSLAVYTIM